MSIAVIHHLSTESRIDYKGYILNRILKIDQKINLCQKICI